MLRVGYYLEADLNSQIDLHLTVSGTSDYGLAAIVGEQPGLEDVVPVARVIPEGLLAWHPRHIDFISSLSKEKHALVVDAAPASQSQRHMCLL